MWTNLLSALGHGVVKGVGAAGKGIKRGVGAIGNEFGDLFDEDGGDDSAVMETPPFIPRQASGGRDMAFRYGRDDAPIALPAGAPPLTNTVSAPALPGSVAPARPALVPTTTPPLTPPASLRSAPAMDPLKDYRGREVTDSTDFERDMYIRRGGMTDAEGNFKIRRSLKDSLLNAGIGFLQGAATTGSLGGGLGGAVAGGAGTAIAPTRGREYRFDTLERPRIEADAEKTNRTRQQRIEKALKQSQVDRAARQAELDAANLKRIEAQTQAILTPKQTRQAPAWRQVVGSDGQPIMVDLNAPENQGKTFASYQKPTAIKEPSTAEKLRQADIEETKREGTPEEIARSSTEARRPDVIAKAPPAFREILQTGKKNGKDATPKQISEAENWLRKRMDAIYRDNLRYTKSVRAKNTTKRVKDKTPSSTPQAQPSSGSGTSRPRSQFNSSKFPGLRFD